MDDTRLYFGSFIEHELAPLHQLRQLVAEDDAERKDIKDAFEAEHADRWMSMAAKKADLVRMEADVKAEALRLYQTIPNAGKTFLPGVTIKEVKAFSWDLDAALEWAIGHKAMVALSVKDAPYKKLIEFGGAPGTVTPSFRADIATDLGPIVGAIQAGPEAF